MHFSPHMKMNTGMKNAGMPKHLFMKKSDNRAPRLPQAFWNSLPLLNISFGRRSSTRLWSAGPEEK